MDQEEDHLRSLGAEYVKLVACRSKPSIARSITYAMRLPLVLRDVRRRFSFDIIYFVNYSLNTLAYPLVRALSLGPIVTDIHSLGSARFIEQGLPKPASVWAMSLILEKIALRLSDAVITPTGELQNVLGLRYGYADKIFTVPNCAWSSDAEGYKSASPVRKDEESKAHWQEPADFTVLFHANFLARSLSVHRSIREFERLFWIVKQVRDRGHNVRLWVAGPGSQVLNKMRFDGIVNLGYVENPVTYLLKSDLVILPIRDQTLGIHSRLVEAMIAGKPVVASKEACCGILSHLQDSGIIVCNTLEQMMVSACSLFEDPERMRVLGQRNAHLADELFSPRRIGADLERVCSAILRGRNVA